MVLGAVLLLAGAVFYYMAARMVPDQARSLLVRHGFTQAVIGSSSFRGDSFVSSDIMLDPDGFSTIRALRVQPDWASFLSGGLIRTVIIDDMRLLGEWQGPRLSIAGWEARKPPYPVQEDIILNGVRLDLDTDYGAIRLETKGRLNRTETGNYKTEAVLYGRQHQLTLDSRWVGAFGPEGAYAFEGEIEEAHIRTAHLEVNRASGWLQIANDGQAGGPADWMPFIAGQMQMGRVSLNGVPLGNVAMTIDGPATALKMILTAEVPGLEGSHVHAEITRQGHGWMIKATVSMNEAQDMLAFLVMLRRNLEAHEANSLTSFLITPGNIERLRKELTGLKFDMVELHIEGPVGALHGGLVAKINKDGQIQRHAISLDPGKRN